MNKQNSAEVTRTLIEAKSRQLNATWTLDFNSIWDKPTAPVDISKLTVDEQADLIVKKLSEPPKSAKSLLSNDDYITLISEIIATSKFYKT